MNVAPHSWTRCLIASSLMAVAMLGAGRAGADVSWNGGTGYWADADNWSTGSVPGSNDDVTIGSGVCYVKDRLVAKSLAVSSGATLYFASTGAVASALMAWPEENAKRTFAVSGDVSVEGTLVIGGARRNRNYVPPIMDFTTLDVGIGGDFTLGGSAKVYAYAQAFPTNECWKAAPTGAAAFAQIYTNRTVVAVTGTLKVGGSSILYPVNDGMTGAAVQFTCTDFKLESGAKVNADNNGWFWYHYTADAQVDARKTQARYSTDLARAGYEKFFTLAPTPSTQDGLNSTMSCYGGGKNPYGYADAPFLPGTTGDQWNGTSRGGGTVWIVASGSMNVSGAISATAVWGSWGSPTGGGVWLCGRRFSAGLTATIDASGADVTSAYTGGAPSGGRVSVGIGLTQSEMDQFACGVTAEDLGLETFETIEGYAAGAVDVCGGARKNSTLIGPTGTVKVVYGSLADVSVTVRGKPLDLLGVEPENGTHAMTKNSTVTFTAGEYGYDPTDPDGIRYGFRGYAVSNATEQLKEGTARSFDLKIDQNPLRVYWLWDHREFGTVFPTTPNVSLKIGSETFTSATTNWTAEGDTVSILAVPDTTHEFLRWQGDVPNGKALDNPLVLTADQARNIAPVVREKTGSSTIAWLGGSGYWADATKWSTGAVPNRYDDVTIGSGTCYVKDGLYANSLTVSSGATVYFASTGSVASALMAWPEENAARQMAVAGDLTVEGTLVLGGARRSIDYVPPIMDYTTLGVSVGGDFKLNGSGKVYAYASSFPANDAWAEKPTDAAAFAQIYSNRTVIAVAGDLKVCGTSLLRPISDGITGAPVQFTCVNFTLDTGAKVDSDNAGWTWYQYTANDQIDARKTQARWATNPKKNYYTLAPTPPTQEGWNTAVSVYGGGSRAYGYPYAPFLPGVPGDTYQGVSRAGGTVWIVAVSNMTVNGTVSATATWSSWNPPPGGGVWLCARTFSAGDQASIDASGADGGAPSGGRVSLGIGLAASEIARLAVGESPESLGLSKVDAIDAIPVDVSGGYQSSSSQGATGTATTTYGSLGDVSLTVCGNPVDLTGVTPANGAYTYGRGSTVAFSAPEYGYDPSDPSGIRYAISGYVISNATAQLAAGKERSVDYTVSETPLRFVWQWAGGQQYGTILTIGEGVSVQAGGQTYSSSGILWANANSSVSLLAVPDATHEFLFWEGEVPYGKAMENPLVLTADKARRIRPFVRTKAAAATATWKGGTGLWTDPEKWDTANVPGPLDEVVIAGGTCSVSNWFRARSVTLSGSAKLLIGQTATDLMEEAGGEVTGNVTLGDSSQIVVAMRNFTRHGRLTVGGNLKMSGSSKLSIAAGPLDGSAFTMSTGGGFLTVGGIFSLEDTATLIPLCEPYTGGGIVTKAHRFVLGSSAKVDAVGHGWEDIPSRNPTCLAPGRGSSYSVGAGYGGRGNNGTGGATYGQANAPIHPGSPKGYWNNTSDPGGGLVRIHADLATINGTVDATGSAPRSLGACSGGGVWITTTRRLKLGPTAVLRAKGTWRSYGNNQGGGGRIALGTYMKDDQRETLAATGECEDLPVYEGTNTQFAVDFPGATVDVRSSDGGAGGAGTFRYLVGPKPSLTIIVR